MIFWTTFHNHWLWITRWVWLGNWVSSWALKSKQCNLTTLSMRSCWMRPFAMLVKCQSSSSRLSWPISKGALQSIWNMRSKNLSWLMSWWIKELFRCRLRIGSTSWVCCTIHGWRVQMRLMTTKHLWWRMKVYCLKMSVTRSLSRHLTNHLSRLSDIWMCWKAYSTRESSCKKWRTRRFCSNISHFCL